MVLNSVITKPSADAQGRALAAILTHSQIALEQIMRSAASSSRVSRIRARGSNIVLMRNFTALAQARFKHAASLMTAATQYQPATRLYSPPSEHQKAVSETYEQLVQRLYQVNRFTAVKLGLENMQHLNDAFGNPASRYEVVHVAGTNGKGSVAFKIAKALERSGYRTGLFVSPHVSCFRERVQLNGELISEQEVCATLSEIFNVSAQLRIPATFFELTTMMAFQHFAKQNVDCVVLEAGLGGRLDSTNIVTPSLSVITSIGMDHTRILGNSIPEIAREKAGIIKPRVPVVIGPHAPLELMQEHATKHQSPLVQVPLMTSFHEDYNAENTAIAREACVQLNVLSHGARAVSELMIDLDSKRVISALESRPPCRFQVVHIVRPNSKERKVSVVLDVAHNPPAIERLVQLLRKRFPSHNYRFVCGFSADKDMGHVMTTIASVIDTSGCDAEAKAQLVRSRMHLVKANHPRGASLDEINDALTRSETGRAFGTFEFISSIKEGVDAALAAARRSKEEEVVVVCGSVFLMAEARQALGFKEPIDSPTLNAVSGSHLSTPESRRLTAKA